MSRGREYQYERIDRALEAQDDWYLQRRKEIQEEDEYVQTKLEISQPGDVHEQEADRIASIVVGGGNANVNTHTSSSSVQPSGTGTEMVDAGFKTSLESSKGGGNALDESTRSEMESKMGADFSGVKIHTGGEASAMSENINAKAFTNGNDVYFNEGKYNPTSSEGKELLAHELVHTVQQDSGRMVGIHRKTKDEYFSPWIKRAIKYNTSTLNIAFKAKFIWKLFYVTGNETQQADAFGDSGYSDGFAHLVHSAQLLLFPSEFLEGEDISPEAGQFNERTYRAVLDYLRGEPKLTDEIFNAVWYNVNVYKVDMASAEIKTLFTLMTPLQKMQSEDLRLGEINLAKYWGEIQGVYLWPRIEFKRGYLSASEITEARAEYDRKYPQGTLSVTVQQPMFMTNVPNMASLYTPEEKASSNAPSWLWDEVKTQVVDKLKWDERNKLKNTGSKDFTTTSGQLFSDDLMVYMNTYKDDKGKGPRERLYEYEIVNFDVNGKKLVTKPVTTPHEAEAMISAVFNDLMRIEFNEEKTEEFVLETSTKLDSFDVLPVSSTGYAYYSAKYQLDKQQKMEEYAAQRSGEIEKEFAASLEAKSKPIKEKYQTLLNDFIAAKEAEYEPQFIDAIKTGDAYDDQYAPMFRKLQVERGDPLTEKQKEVETKMQKVIDDEEIRLNDLMFSEINQIQVDLQSHYNKRFELDFTAYSEGPVFLTAEMIETAKKNVDTKKYADKKDEDVSSSDYSDRLRDCIYQEWYALSLSTAYWDLLDKAVPLSKFQTKDEDRFGSRMMDLDGGYVQPPSDISVWSYHRDQWQEQAEAEFFFLLMSREMVDGMGRPSYAALKWWAFEWFGFIMDELEVATDPEEISLYNKAKIHMLDILSTPEEDKDFWDEFATGFFRGEPTYIIPFIGDFIEIYDLVEIKNIAERYAAGDYISPAEKLAIQSYGALQDIESRGYSLGLTIGSGVRQAIPFILEFIATFGLYSAAKTVLVKSGVKLLKNTMKTGMKKVVKKLSIELISSSLAAGWHALFNPQVYFKTFVNNTMPRYMTFIDGEGMMLLNDVGEKMSFWENFRSTAFSTYVDFWTEHLGGFLLKQPKAILTRILNTDKRIANSVITSWLFNNKLIPRNSFFKTSGEIAKALGKGFLKGKGLLSKYNIGNVGEEFFEEYIATRLNDWYDGKPFQIYQQADVEALITTLFISGPMQIVGIAKKTYQTLNNPNGNVVLNVRVMENDKPVDKEFEFPNELIQKLDGLGKVDVAAASVIIDAHFANNPKYTDPTEIAHLRSVLLTYHVQGSANPDVAVWAYSTLADGNLDIAYSVVHLQGPTPVTPDHITQLRKLPTFAPVADTLAKAIELKTDDAMVVSMQNLLGSNQLADLRRTQIANAWMKGMQYMERPLTSAELDGEVTIADQRAEMKEDIQPVYDWLRLPKESSVDFMKRADQLRGDIPIAEYVEQNKDNIMKYRLDDPLYKGFVDAQKTRVNAGNYSQTTKDQYAKDQKTYQENIDNTENIQTTDKQKEQTGVLEEFEDVDVAAQQGELEVNLENRVTDNLFGTTAEQAVTETGNKRFRRTFDRRKRKFNEALLDPSLDADTRKKRTEKYMRRLKRSFKHHGKEGAVKFDQATADVNLIMEVQGQQRYIMNTDGTFVMDGKTMTLTQLQQQLDSANLLMQFNGLPRRYSYTTRSVKVGKEVKTEVIITSSEQGPFPNVSVNRSDNADVSRLNTDATISLSQRAGPDVLLEEYAHLWLQLADRIDPSLINSVMTQVQQTQAYQQIMNDPFYGPLGRASADPVRYWVNEVLAQAVRTNGASLGTQTKPGWFTSFVSEMWEAVLNALRKLGFNIPKTTQASSLGSMTVEEFVQLVRGELTGGKTITNSNSQQILNFLLGITNTLNIQNSVLAGKDATGTVTLENMYSSPPFDPSQFDQPAEYPKIYRNGKTYTRANGSNYEWTGMKWEKVDVILEVERIGSYDAYTQEIEISKLTPIHPTPKATVSEGHIGSLERKLLQTGWNLNEPIPVVELPDGILLVIDGHHRLQAMVNLGQQTVPVDVMSIRDAVLRYGELDVAAIIELAKMTGSYKGTFTFVQGGKLETARTLAKRFLQINFPDIKLE